MFCPSDLIPYYLAYLFLCALFLEEQGPKYITTTTTNAVKLNSVHVKKEKKKRSWLWAPWILSAPESAPVWYTAIL